MAFLVVFILTLLSCLIFENLDIIGLVKKLTSTYKQQMKVMTSKDTTDEAKQKELLSIVARQVVLLLKLILYIFLFISPFLLIVLGDGINEWLSTEVLYSPEGIGVSIVGVFIYIAIKKTYARLFHN